MNDLKPCPFCGGDAYTEIYIVEAAAGCRECQFKVTREHRPYEYDGLPKVIAAWNTRALPAVRPDPREAALRDIARQKKTDEMDTEYDVEYADFEGGYNAIIDVARRALPAVQPDADELVGHMTKLIAAGLDRIEALTAERDRLREALDETAQILSQCTFETIRVHGQYIDRREAVSRARAALKGETP